MADKSYKIGDDIGVRTAPIEGVEQRATGKVIGFIVDVTGKGLMRSRGLDPAVPIKMVITRQIDIDTAVGQVVDIPQQGGRRKRRMTRRRR